MNQSSHPSSLRCFNLHQVRVTKGISICTLRPLIFLLHQKRHTAISLLLCALPFICICYMIDKDLIVGEISHLVLFFILYKQTGKQDDPLNNPYWRDKTCKQERTNPASCLSFSYSFSFSRSTWKLIKDLNHKIRKNKIRKIRRVPSRLLLHSHFLFL